MSKPPDVLDARLNLRCSPEWRRWVHDFADSRRLTISDLIAAALADRAKKAGFAAPPSNR